MTFGDVYLTHWTSFAKCRHDLVEPVICRRDAKLSLQVLKAVLPDRRFGKTAWKNCIGNIIGQTCRLNAHGLPLYVRPRGGFASRQSGRQLHNRRACHDRGHMLNGAWRNAPGVFNLEQFDPDPTWNC